MEILDRISLLLNDRDQKELTNYLNLKNSAFSDWKSGKSQSFRKYLIEISEFFDVSIDYLVYGKEKISASELTGAEKRLLAAFKELPTDEQMAEVGRIELMAEQAVKAKNAETA